jgi:hypothetical protein
MKLYLTLGFVVAILCLASCVSIYFNNPQPTDAKNIKNFPRKIRGTWIEDGDTTSIRKKTFRKVEWEVKSISKAELDTTQSLVVKGDKIFDVESDSVQGYYYEFRDDSFFVNIPQITMYELGEGVLFRRVSKSYFTLSINTDSIWWNVYLIEILPDESILVKYPKKSELSILETMLENEELEIKITPYEDDKLTTSEFQKFWNVGLTSKQMLGYISKGGFSDTTLVINRTNKFKK